MKDSPLATVILPRIEKLHIKFLEDMAQVEFLKEIKGNPYELVFYVTLFTEMRQGEIPELTWDCVDFE